LPVVSGVSADAFLASMRDAGYSCRLLSDSGQAGPFVETASDANDVAANVIFVPNRERTLARALPQGQPPECRANL
jgi:hypothetical protein